MVARRSVLNLLTLPALWALAACQPAAVPAPKAEFKGIDITGADYARELDLPDTEGQRRQLPSFAGKVTVVFFGYTQCPDVCPGTMLELAEVKKSLGAEGERVQGVFITLDPARDTPGLLKAYVANFGPGIVALRGSVDETKAAAKHFKVFFNLVPGQSAGTYTVDHTAGSFIFDEKARVRLFTRYGTGAEALRSDLKLLLAGA